MNKPEYGISIWRKDSDRIESIIEKISEKQVTHVEVSIDSPLDIDEALLKMIDRIKANNISIGIHAPWREIHLASPVTPIRGSSVKVISDIFNSLTPKDIKYIVIHGSSEQMVCNENTGICIRSLAKSISELRDRIQIPIAIETIQGKCCGAVEHIIETLKNLALKRESNIYVAIDLAHIAAEKIKSSNRVESSLSVYLNNIPKTLLDRTLLLHLHGLKVSMENNRIKVKSHYDFSYIDLGYMDMARFIHINSIKYIVMEIFYASNKDKDPISVAVNEISNIRKYENIYQTHIKA